jgi:hypothetical protein
VLHLYLEVLRRTLLGVLARDRRMARRFDGTRILTLHFAERREPWVTIVHRPKVVMQSPGIRPDIEPIRSADRMGYQRVSNTFTLKIGRHRAKGCLRQV